MLRRKNDYHLVHHILTITHSQGSYPIFIGENLLNSAHVLTTYVRGPQVAIITDAHVSAYYLDRVRSNFSKKQCDTLVLPAGETHKTMTSFNHIVDFLSEKQHHRDTTLIALGGGVIGDLTGFVASCYHRGVSFIQIPTSLLAQVDASIGGKTAVNQPQAKNLIGAFYQPNTVIIDLDTLDTLPEREYQSGLAEIIKAALIKDSLFFAWLEAHIEQLKNKEKLFIKEAIFRACTIKSNVVMADEKEKMGERALLNFGHTFGHAIEHDLGYGECLHGEAVGLGMRIAATLSYQLGMLTKDELERIINLLNCLTYPRKLPKPLTPESMLNTMMHDKKIQNNRLNFILLQSIGTACIKNDITLKTVQTLLTEFT